jgi:16S rRNA (cytidine1402-2'-O)-methyltransferase
MRSAELVERMRHGASLALVSDAGSPLVSDPGLTLVRAARASGLAVAAVPGPSAVTAALSIAGLATDRFVFEGFLPRRQGALEERLKALQAEPRTMVFFEAVHRLASTAAALIEHFGADRPAALARELTKLHEQCVSATLGELGERLGKDIPLRGEFVLLVAGAAAAATAEETEVRRVFALLARELDAKRAVDLTARITGLPRNAVYRLTRT